LFGQPELDSLLAQPGLHQLRDELSFHHKLAPLDRKEIQSYVDHRLRKAGYNGQQLFADGALDLVFEASKGTPRLVSILCHKAMMVAYGKGLMTVSADCVKAATDDTDALTPKKSWAERLFSRGD